MTAITFSRPPHSLDVFQLLIVPGRGNSGARHWQTLLEAERAGARRVMQEDWEHPQLDAWARRVQEETERADKPVLVVAHSYGCLATVAAGLWHGVPIAGALLVAPADPARFQLDESVLGSRLPFPAILVLSRNDPWLGFEAGYRLGRRWQTQVVDLGQAGHINSESGYGHWAFVHSLLDELAARAMPAVAVSRLACPVSLGARESS